MRVLPRVKRRWRWLAAFIFLLWLAVLAADRLWPLPLQDVTPARVVVAEDGRRCGGLPTRRASGVIRSLSPTCRRAICRR
jgi:hypothetical protein